MTTTAPDDGTTSDTVTRLSAALTAALADGTREAFTELLTEDVRWGGEGRGAGNECTTREQAGEHYAGLRAAGVTLRIADLQPVPAGGGDVLVARMQIDSPDPDDIPPEMAIRLTLRDGLIADICVLDSPPTIEVL